MTKKPSPKSAQDLLASLVFKVAQTGDSWGVFANDKPLMTPGKTPYAVPTRALAEAVAEEWQAQKGKIDHKTMPMTSLAATALDLIAGAERARAAALAAYGENDLLCYRASWPEALAQRQTETWQPFLDWAEADLGALFRVGEGVMPLTQEPRTIQKIREKMEGFGAFELAGLQLAIEATGSLVLALALAAGRDARTVFEAAQLDETFECEAWGDDPVTTARRAEIERDLNQAARFLTLL